MKSLTFFKPDTGEITGQITADDQSIAVTMAADFIHCIEGTWLAEEYYVVSGLPVNRPVGTSVLVGNTLNNLPIPCKIIINGESYDCIDQTATLEFTQPTVYKIKVVAFPYLDKEFEIDYSA